MEGFVRAVSAPDPTGADDRAKRNRTINASRAPALLHGNPMSVVLRRIVLGLVACACAAGLGAQPAPKPPLRILVGFAAGGTTDTAARALAAELTVSLDRTVIVDNRPGASGRIAASALRQAPPDGATVMLAPMVVTVLAPLLWERPGYEPARDFAPVAHVAGFAIAIAVGSNVPARSIAEFAAWAKDAPGGASYGVSAAGGLPHLFAELVGRTAGIDWVAVPYRGLAPLEVDLVGGRLPAAVDALSNLIELHRSGRARILAVSGERRSPLLPGVATFREQGLAAIDGHGWLAMHAPAGTPPSAIDALSSAIGAALRVPRVREQLIRQGFEPTGTTPGELAVISAADAARWAPVIRAAGFRGE
jgi:tripartite-type tricarboxylate transporter receptor subunit TctC